MPSIPGYKIVRLLNNGGFGHVHLAQRIADGAQAAIKLLHLPNDENVRRFYREAKLLHQQIGNPYVVELFNADLQHVPPYIAMEYCAGGSLRAWVGKSVDWLEIVFALSNSAAGLSKIHEIGGFHRDIKPDNLLICLKEDGSKIIKVGDFGLARVPLTTEWPMTRNPGGTKGYTAPELARGAEYDKPCDVYSLGITGIELLTGALTPMSLSQRVDIPAQLRDLLRSMIHPHAGLRPNMGTCQKVFVDVGQAEYAKRQDAARAEFVARERARQAQEQQAKEQTRQTQEQQARERARRAQEQQAREHARQAQERQERARQSKAAAAGVGLGIGSLALIVGGIALATMNSSDGNGRWRGRNGRFRSGPWG